MTAQLNHAAVIVCSDRARAGVYADESGQAAKDALELQGHTVTKPTVIYDDATELTAALEAALVAGASLVVVSGGTGLGPRDITPETLDRICDYQIPGFGELLRRESLRYSLNAYLSRCGGWVKGRTLVLGLPGNPKAVREQLGILADLLPHALKSIAGACKDRRAPGAEPAGIQA